MNSRFSMKAAGRSFWAWAARGELLLQPVDHLDRLAALISALGVSGPAGADCRAHSHEPPRRKVVADDQEKPLWDPVTAEGPDPGQGVGDLGIG